MVRRGSTVRVRQRASGSSWSNDSVLVREDDSLDAVAQPELGEQAGDVRLDRRRLDDELALRSRRWSGRGRAGAGRLARARSARSSAGRRRRRGSGELLDQPAGACGGEQRVAVVRRCGTAATSCCGGARLEQEAATRRRGSASTTYSSRSNVVRISTRVAAQLRRAAGASPRSRPAPACGCPSARRRARLERAASTASSPSPASPTTSMSGSALEDQPEAAAHERLVVGEQDADHAAPVVERQPRAHDEAAVRPAAGLELAAEHRDALAHPDQAVTACRRRSRCRRRRRAPRARRVAPCVAEVTSRACAGRRA